MSVLITFIKLISVFAGTERTGIPAAPEQQQLKPADPQGA